MKHKLWPDRPLVEYGHGMWKMLRVVGDTRTVPGAGRLFREA